MASTISHVRAALITFAVIGAVTVAISPDFRETSLGQVSAGAAQMFGATAAFHTTVDTATARLNERLPAAAPSTVP